MRRQDPKIARLRSVALFAPCSDKELALVARLADELTVPAGRRLMREGGYGVDCVVVLEGEAKVLRDGDEIARLGPGDVAGEIALLDRGPRTATVVAESPMRVLVIDVRALSTVLATSPGIRFQLLRTVASRLRSANRAATAAA